MNRPLVPAFLKKLDQHLLLNNPNTWTTRVHLLVYYCILFCMGIGLFAFIFFNDPRLPSQAEGPMFFTFLISFIGLVVWLIFLLRFNLFKRFGEDKWGNGLKTFLLFFIGFFFLVFTNYVPLLIESWKANKKYSGVELVRDANKINELIVIQNKAEVPTDWETDTLLLVDDKDIRLSNNSAEYDDNVRIDTEITSAPAYTTPDDYKLVDKMELTDKLGYADSVLKLNDSMYVTARCPNLEFVTASTANDHVNEKFLSSKQLYDSIVKGNVSINEKQLNELLNQLLNKYENHSKKYYFDYNPNDRSFNAQINSRYKIESVNSSIYNITDKKYKWNTDNFPIYFRIIFYCSFILTILLFIFRHSTVRTFFMSVLTVVVLMIITGIFVTATHSTELGILGIILFYFVLAVIVLALSQANKTRTLPGGIALNLVTAFVAFVPLFCVFYYYQLLQERMGYNYFDGFTQIRDRNLLIAEIAGILLFVILLEPVFKKLYRKWYALPEN